MRRLILFSLAAVTAILFTACASDPVFYTQVYNEKGERTDLLGPQREPAKKTPAETPLSRLFAKYPVKVPEDVFFRPHVGLFFMMTDDRRGFGTDFSDILNQAAFLVLQLPPDKQKAYAARIGDAFLTSNIDKANTIFAELGSGLIRSVTYYDNDIQKPHKNICISARNRKRHGLQRSFHENGMVAEEYYCKDGEVQQYTYVQFDEDGRPVNRK